MERRIDRRHSLSISAIGTQRIFVLSQEMSDLAGHEIEDRETETATEYSIETKITSSQPSLLKIVKLFQSAKLSEMFPNYSPSLLSNCNSLATGCISHFAFHIPHDSKIS
jgi:hypothetical protein